MAGELRGRKAAILAADGRFRSPAPGSGMVAAINGRRFVVPVPSLMAQTRPEFFGPKRGKANRYLCFMISVPLAAAGRS
jgi:hypothetical protein